MQLIHPNLQLVQIRQQAKKQTVILEPTKETRYYIMQKRTLTAEQKKADHNLWIIALITMAVYCIYGIFGSSIMAFCKDTSISVWPRLFTAAGTEYGIAGLGIDRRAHV